MSTLINVSATEKQKILQKPIKGVFSSLTHSDYLNIESADFCFNRPVISFLMTMICQMK